jgi:DNA repair protein RadA/Sms
MFCRRCEYPIKTGRYRCDRCGAWNTQQEKSPEKDKIEGTDEDGTVLLSEVTSAENSRVRIGQWDPVWGGGIVATSTTLFGGIPGAGKSTMLLQVIDLFLHNYNKKEALYVAAEECLPEVRLRADRLGMKNQNRLRMVPAMQGVDNLAQIMLGRKPALMIFDSLQGLAPHDNQAQEEICKITKEYAIKLESPVVIISHVNKEGDISGLEDLQHDVDTTMLLSANEEGTRCLTVLKNRFGPAHVEMYFEMTKTGLSIVNPEDNEDDEDEKLF